MRAARLDAIRVILDQGLRDLILVRQDEIGHPYPELAATYVVD